MKKKSTTIIFVITIIIACVSVSVFVLFIRFIRSENENASTATAILSQKINQKQHSDILSKNIKETKDFLDKINLYFIDPSQIDLFINKIEGLGGISGTTLFVKNIEISKTQTHTISLNVSIQGTFSSVMRALELIEFSPYQIHFKNIYFNKNIGQTSGQSNISSVKNSQSNPLWQVDASFDVVSSI